MNRPNITLAHRPELDGDAEQKRESLRYGGLLCMRCRERMMVPIDTCFDGWLDAAFAFSRSHRGH